MYYVIAEAQEKPERVDMEFSLWGMIGAIATVVGVLVMVVIAVASRTRKSLSCVVSSVPVLNIRDRTDTSDVKVLHGQTEVQSLERVRIRFRNSGNRALAPTDFVRPIVVAVDPPAIILTATVIESSPEDVSEGLEHLGPGEIQVIPLLMNPKDEFSVETLVGDLASGPSIRGRIMEGKLKYREQRDEDTREQTAARSQRAAIFAAFLGLIVFSVGIDPFGLESLLTEVSEFLTIEALLGFFSVVTAVVAASGVIRLARPQHGRSADEND